VHGGEDDAPIGQRELLLAMQGARRVLDAGCGSGRLTLALGRTGSSVTGIDTGRGQLERARARAAEAGVEMCLVECDFNVRLPFGDAAFDGVVSRLALMAADDPVATLRELARVLAIEGRLATAVWASPEENPWFAIPREAVGAVLGGDRASFARAFGRLGDVGEATAAHCAAGLRHVQATVVVAPVSVSSAAEQWDRLTRDIGHFRRIAGSIDEEARSAIVDELDARLAPFREGGRLTLARTLVLVTARR
jgi:SAM-dependent methyltransferase